MSPMSGTSKNALGIDRHGILSEAFGADFDLHWTTDVIQKVISAYSTKMGHYEHD